MAENPPTQWGHRTLPFAACVLLLLAALANFLVHNDYPLLRPEVALVATVVVGLSVVTALLYLVLPRWARAIMEGLLAALFVELNSTSLPLALGVGIAVAGLGLWRRISLTGPMALFGGIVLVTTLLGLGGRTPWIHSTRGKDAPSMQQTASSLPVVLHIILDEQIGIEGLRSSPEAVRFGQELKSFYRGAGFATYGGAYSEHMRTMNAIPHVLNYGERLGGGMRGRTAMVGPTRHLEGLVDRGYRLTILQADYADFCTGARFAECVTFETSSPTALLGAPLTMVERAGLIATKFLSLSRIVSALLLPWRYLAEQLHLPKLDPANLGRSTSVASLGVFDELSKRLARARPGEAYFAHILLPHYPYALDGDCRVLDWRSWKKPFAPRSITIRQQAYIAQDRCTTRLIGEALAALARSPAGRDAVVIIHGDHGSRITRFDPTPANIGKFDDADLISDYSTLFAVRAPGVPPGYSAGRQPIHQLLRDFAASDFKAAPEPRPIATPSVHLDGPDGRPAQRIPLPPGWRD